MMWLGQQAVRLMQDAGYPAKIHCVYRPPQAQRLVYDRGHSKALPFESPHQYFEAVDIIHPSLGWNVSDRYWQSLAHCWEILGDKHEVDLSIGHYWKWRDSAHVQLRDWRGMKERVGEEIPTDQQLQERFQEVLPKVWAARHKR